MIVWATHTVYASFGIRAPFKNILRKLLNFLSDEFLKHLLWLRRKVRINTIISCTVKHDAVKCIIPNNFFDHINLILLHLFQCRIQEHGRLSFYFRYREQSFARYIIDSLPLFVFIEDGTTFHDILSVSKYIHSSKDDHIAGMSSFDQGTDKVKIRTVEVFPILLLCGIFAGI